MIKLNQSEVQERVAMTIEDVISDLFTQVNGEFKCVSGDFAPDQEAELDEVKLKLQDLLTAYVFQNQKVESRYAEKPKETAERFEGRVVYTYNGKKYIRDSKSGCNALEGFLEVQI